MRTEHFAVLCYGMLGMRSLITHIINMTPLHMGVGRHYKRYVQRYGRI